MEVFLYNSTVCRLCGEENDSGTLLYSCEENSQSLSEIINTFLPIKVSDDGQLPRTICPGCTIQLEATVEFLNLIIKGQKIIRDLHQREKEYKKTVFTTNSSEDVVCEKIIYEINASDGVYHVEHPISLQVAGLEKPKRRRGRPPKKAKNVEELAKEAAAKESELAVKKEEHKEEIPGKRRRKTPTRFKEAVQGKELERIFIEEGVTDGDDSEGETRPDVNPAGKPPEPKEPEVIGHMETSGELVVVVKGKGRGRPKGRMRQTREQCAICGMEFSCVGRYMSHVAQHGPVMYQCCDAMCDATFNTRVAFQSHQSETGHQGQKIIQCRNEDSNNLSEDTNYVVKMEDTLKESNQPVESSASDLDPLVLDMTSLPELSEKEKADETEFIKSLVNGKETSEHSSPSVNSNGENVVIDIDEAEEVAEVDSKGKVKMKCPHCDKLFSNKQSKSMHIKAVHLGERPYACGECGARFAYPRSRALHALAHRRARAAPRYACDLCGKVLNHPSSVVYHKEAEHAGQRYVCNKCGKSFKHKQLLQRHQLVHSQLRPYSCKTCNASFKTKANLINHQLLHSGIKKFTCEICKHKFAHKTSLTLHMRWHTGSKPFVCKVCNKSFSQKGNLSEHERIHTGEKPYQCGACARRFTTSSQFRLHARRHQADRPFAFAHFPKRTAAQARRAARRRRPHACAHCPRSFAQLPALNNHYKQVHKQISLLVSDKNQDEQPGTNAVVEVSPGSECDSDLEERVIYVTYDVDEEPGFHILDTEQIDQQQSLVGTPAEGRAGALAPPPARAQAPPPPLAPLPQLPELTVEEHIAVTDEDGNPLHFTMQDGTRLAITSADGKSLQVVTQDGQTIPVEINGFNADEEEQSVEEVESVIDEISLPKIVDAGDISSPVTHYFTIV